MMSVTLHKSIPYHLLEEIASQCSRFESEVLIVKDDYIVNGRNLMGLVTLSLHPEDQLKLSIEGSDAEIIEHILMRLLN
ncbi:HPr family phosphocarrier protein [Ammoniphilus sp. YIM 78166]|uniref:HPr family phosphocarrier protein n=1 Tax=Ammoniphilus sp. YIM 78166 TaxID=1644106 RepID=UPI0014308617|nr:HPr family phosphocarrier protein [Ammoniphilus sp. YIM 78166]